MVKLFNPILGALIIIILIFILYAIGELRSPNRIIKLKGAVLKGI